MQNIYSHPYNQNMPAYTDGSLSHRSEASYENPLHVENGGVENTPSLEGKAASFYAVPVDIPPTALGSSDTPPAMENLPGFPYHSSSSSHPPPSTSSSLYLVSSLGDSAPGTSWSRTHSGVPSAVKQGSHHLPDQESGNYTGSRSPPDGLGTLGGNLATSVGRAHTTKTADNRLEPYGAINSGRPMHGGVPKQQNYGRTTDQIGVQGTRFTCTFDNCGKSFSGEWEKTRHIKSLHSLPTIRCLDCNYRQSRKDLFSEHCKKRHPGIPMGELMVMVDISQ